MFKGEESAWMILAALMGGGGTAILLFSAAALRSRRGGRDDIRRRICARWLASRWTLSRASLSLVAAFRSLAREGSDSPFYALRQEETQRMRASWCEAQNELDRAEAELWVQGLDHRDGLGVQEPLRVGADALRIAIEGDAQAVAVFAKALRAADQAARRRVTDILGEGRSRLRGGMVREAWFRWTATLSAITDQWAKRP